MNSLFNIEPEKYWDFTSKYTATQKKNEIIARIASINIGLDTIVLKLVYIGKVLFMI